jgi:branched-chain amino acid transport system permease protein
MSGVAVLAQVSGTDFWTNLFQAFALGAKYALIALGFVVVHRATGVINFANGGFVVVGAYLTYNFSNTWGLNFYLAILLSMVGGFILGVALEALILRKLVGEATFTVIMVTIGLLFIIEHLVMAIWGAANLNLGDPWTGNTTYIGAIRLNHTDLWALGFTAAVLTGFLLFFRYSRMGLAMRATALDPEAAQAQGISARTVYRITWGIAGLVAALAGTTFATGTGQLQVDSILPLALAAFPAMVLGGMDSPLGAVIGGMVIGLVQQMTQLFAPHYLEFLGTSVDLVAPYLVMVAILLVRPYGLFGVSEVRRA